MAQTKSVSLPKTAKVTVAGVEVTVKKQPIIRYIQVVERLEALPAVALNLVSGEGADLASVVVAAMRVAHDEFFDILSIASGVPKETLLDEDDGVKLDEIVDFVDKFIEINRLDYVSGKIGAALRRFIPALKGA